LTKIDEDLDREKAIDLITSNSFLFSLINAEIALKMVKKAEKMYNIYRLSHRSFPHYITFYCGSINVFVQNM